MGSNNDSINNKKFNNKLIISWLLFAFLIYCAVTQLPSSLIAFFFCILAALITCPIVWKEIQQKIKIDNKIRIIVVIALFVFSTYLAGNSNLNNKKTLIADIKRPISSIIEIANNSDFSMLPTATTQNNEEQKNKTQQERTAQEQTTQTEQQRIAQEEATAQAEQERIAQEQAAAAQAEQERIAQEQAAAAQAEQERIAQEQANQSSNESNFNTYNNTEQQNTSAQYVLNTKSLKIHHPSCSSVAKISSENYATSNLSVEELTKNGYTTCGKCFK